MKKELNRDELYKMYIKDNLSRKEVAEILGVTERTLIRRLEEYKIFKDTGRRFENIKKTLSGKYGTDYQKHFNEKAKKTMINRYGVEYTAQSPELLQKMQTTMTERYGKKNYVETSEFQDKSSATCVDKFGVEWPCQFPQCVKALFTASGHSVPEENFAKLLQKYNIEYEKEFSLGSYRYDFKVGNYLFEINPTVTHNSSFGVFGKEPKSRTYHSNKTRFAKEHGYRCVHVWDWDDPEKIVSLYLIKKEKIYARDCSVRIVSRQDAVSFINSYHLQGYAKDSVRIGLYYNEELISIMTFDKPRYNKKYQYELVRFCSSRTVIGGSERLFKYFLDNYNPESIISYCDLSKFNGDVYKKLGFNGNNTVKSSAHWYNIKTKQHVTDNLLRARGFDQLFNTNFGKGISNEELMLKHGFIKIYDCGQAVYHF